MSNDATDAPLHDPDLTEWLQLSGDAISRVRPAGERVLSIKLS